MDSKTNEQIIYKFEEIDHKNGLILIDNIINNYYDEDFIKNIIISLSKNKKKHIYEIYDYIIKNTNINYYTKIHREWPYGTNILKLVIIFYYYKKIKYKI